jgi:hypothetical protein
MGAERGPYHAAKTYPAGIWEGVGGVEGAALKICFFLFQIEDAKTRLQE